MDTSKIVDALQQDNNLDAEAQFKSVMQQKIGDALETKRREVANNFVKSKLEDNDEEV